MGRPYVRAFSKALKRFCKETSVVGFKYLVRSRQSRFERYIWWLLQLCLLAATSHMIIYNFKDFLENPILTSVETYGYSIKNIYFPAISICNINKISKKRAEEFAKILSIKANVSLDKVLSNLKILGTLYDFGLSDASRFIQFQRNMERYGRDNNTRVDDYLYYVMKNLSTPCEELIINCIWKRQERNCSEMFRLRRTYEGFCCTFNYLRTSRLDLDLNSPGVPEVLENPGIHYGLILKIRNDPDDYFYPLIPSIGTSVNIFDPLDYPDATSGNLIQEFADVGHESFFNLDASTVYSDPETRKYPVDIRKCIFDNELQTAFGRYSGSNCLAECRVNSILALCQCVPFIIPWQSNTSECSLTDIPCLNSYQEKWRSFYPTDFESDELEHEKQNSLHCPNCYPACSSTTYHVSTSFSSLNLRGPNKKQFENYSVIRIYYGKRHTKLFKQEVLLQWFEMLSDVGGILSIFLGISILSMIELIYFVTIRFNLILTRA